MKKLIGLFFVVVLLSACDETPSKVKEVVTPSAAPAVVIDVAKESEKKVVVTPISIRLLYKIEEPNIEPYESRIIITNKYIRLDDNNDGNDFVLVDRAKQIVYSVSDENDAILVVKHQEVTIKSPIEMYQETVRTPEKDSPKIDGRELVHYVFKINGQACQDAMVAEGLMKDAADAISEYRQILAGQHAKTLNITPADLRDTCDMAINIFLPDQYLQFGLPIHERDHTGYQRSLIDFDDAYEPKAALFILPKEFDQFSIDELQVPAVEAPVTEAPLKAS